MLAPYIAVAASLFGLGACQGATGPSEQCRQSLDGMLKDAQWKYVNNSATRWCRLILENEMSRCCTLSDFANGKAEGCKACSANCQHANMDTLCNDWFGQACTVRRKPFFSSGAEAVEVIESFCVPKACAEVQADVDSLIRFFSALYVGRRNGWHLDYDQATLECPSATVQGIITACFVIIILLACIPVGVILFKAPKERGRTLISQADMQASQGEDDMDGTLRGSGIGGDTLGSSGMGTY